MIRGAFVAALSLTVSTLGCSSQQALTSRSDPLVGAWRSQVQFITGDFTPVTDLEFMYTFNVGGTLTESSNYDQAPPVPPAYGVWRAIGDGEYEARYEFFITNPPATFDEIPAGSGWLPGGRGIITERITLATDGRSFTSSLRYEAFDERGRPMAGGGDATGRAVRIDF